MGLLVLNFDNFQYNLLPAISKGYDNSTEFNNPNEVGASELPYGPRRLVINNINNLILEDKMKLLAGKIVGYVLQKGDTLYYITKEINKALGYNEIEINNNRFIELDNNKFKWFNVIPEEKKLLEVLPGKFIRKHSDIYTNFYNVEIKTTTRPKKQWYELAPYQIMQLNTYLGIDKQDYGFLLKMDLNFMKSASKGWSYVWNNYFLLYPINFNQKLFDFTIEKTKQHFKYIENKTPLSEIPCPEFPEFECSNECKKHCPNPIDKVKVKVNETCYHCKQEIRADTQLLIRNDRTYHYTSEKMGEYAECVEAAKKAYRTKEVE